MINTIKPGATPGRNGATQAPHINLWIVARGINVGLNTRIYFEEDNDAHASDPIINLIEQLHRRDTLLAKKRVRIHIISMLSSTGKTKRCFLMSNNPCIICVAITGSVPTKAANPAVPISVEEQIESTQEAFEAGASICHAHVRNDDETPSSDPEKFARLKEGLEKHCPGSDYPIFHGRPIRRGETRGGMLPLAPDMASLTVGSNNFPTRVYENPPDLVDWLSAEMREYKIKPEIEAFDLSHIHHAVKMNADGRIPGKLYIQFVMGVKNAMLRIATFLTIT